MAAKDRAQIRAYLSQLNTEQLEELLRTDMESSEDSSNELIFAILEVIEEREQANPTGRLPDVSKAWHEFQTCYNTPEGEGRSLYPTKDEEAEALAETAPDTASRRRPSQRYPLRHVLIAAAVVGILIVFALPPALGYETIFEMIGQWTSEQFHFQATGNAPTGQNHVLSTPMPEEYASLQEELERRGITSWTVPHYIPEGFKNGEIDLYKSPTENMFNFSIMYEYDGDIIIFTAQKSIAPHSAVYEKNDEDVENYVYGTVEHYIFSNARNITAAWYYNGIEYSIGTTLPVEELKSMINSMYEV